ncbi:ABC-type transport system, involved in lipoprotein release, permease component [Formivibrio citricus]|uniref:ABC-type transport system, involved in lipoprotein release, permease component n=1 Tax=Formivibrio citricus TaxID=83765 RepID=A0A1I4Y9N0_9NEIS|nr:FtsX-like permease family protein [Formivibrio citricus]SFN34771.1 ABC-type transport system, involved in lipoprotein release, permease component [Formivibrio citricus]
MRYGIPVQYIWRNLFARRLTTLLTAGGMALVVFVFTAVQMLEAGLRSTLVETGSPDNVVVIRAAAQTEIQSSIERSQAHILSTLPYIAADSAGNPLLARECLVLISLNKKISNNPANITVRGTDATGLALRPQVKLVAGRPFHPDSNEIVVGSSIANGFAGVGLGEKLFFARREWQVVGIFDAGKTGFNSEIWGDGEQMMQAFRRPVYSSVVFKLGDRRAFDEMSTRLGNDRRLNVEAKRENDFYADQSRFMATFIRILGNTLSVIFSIGAVLGAMITMYGSVASRTPEIGTLRAIGFRKSRILIAFLGESLLLSLVGGITGIVAASAMQWITLSTMNWQTFSELAFSFTLTPGIVASALAFSLAMGFIGGFLPALRAARLNIIDALRAA